MSPETSKALGRLQVLGIWCFLVDCVPPPSLGHPVPGAGGPAPGGLACDLQTKVRLPGGARIGAGAQVLWLPPHTWCWNPLPCLSEVTLA